MESQADIVTVTLNPAIDQTVFLNGLHVGRVNRALGCYRQPGGKGINVSSMLGQFGIPSIATGFLGHDNPQLFDDLFRHLPITDEFIRLPGETRTGIKIVDEGTCQTTDINFPGLTPTPKDLQHFEHKLRGLVKPGRWFVLAGSLPDGLEPGYFAEIIAILKSGGARIAADTSGEALALAIHGGADLVKPNEHELAEYLGHDLPDLASRIGAARALQREKVPHVILSLGSEGALFLSPNAALMASAPPVHVTSTVGAGDSLLAGYLAGLTTGKPPDECARLATVFAWAALEHISRTLPDAQEIHRRLPKVIVRPLFQMEN
jgi:1-phosphofructokinase